MNKHENALHDLRQFIEMFDEQEHQTVVEYRLNNVVKVFGELVDKYNKEEKGETK